jgi:hypothetical protein
MLRHGASRLDKPPPGLAGLTPLKHLKLGPERGVNYHRRIKEIADVRDVKRPGVPLRISDD